MAQDTSTTVSLEQVLESTAQRIVRDGTRSQSAILEELAAAAGAACAGAAAALVDWDGPEIARLRAFAIVHRVLLREAAPAPELTVAPAAAASTSARAA